MRLKASIFFKAILILSLLCICLLQQSCSFFKINPLKSVKRWFILLNYDPSSKKIDTAAFSGFDMAILDPDSHPELDKLPRNLILIAYLSVGEAEDYRSNWDKIKGKSWLAGENKNWKGSYFIDPRSEEWKRLLIDETIPAIIKKGFKGLMLDTLDTSIMLEEADPKKYGGANRAMADLVRAIHERYPGLLLISNNGFSILPEISPVLSGMLAESINTTIDFEANKYIKNTEADKEQKVRMLTEMKERYALPVFVIDYVSQDDKPAVADAAKKDRELGFVPYIAEKELDKIYAQG